MICLLFQESAGHGHSSGIPVRFQSVMESSELENRYIFPNAHRPGIGNHGGDSAGKGGSEAANASDMSSSHRSRWNAGGFYAFASVFPPPIYFCHHRCFRVLIYTSSNISFLFSLCCVVLV